MNSSIKIAIFMSTVLVLAAVIAVTIILTRSSDSDDAFYMAGVVEYHQDNNSDVNLQNYVDFIHQAAEQNVDILVFPEMTLTRGMSVKVPIYGLLQSYSIPALHPELYDNILVALSQAARDAQMYVIVNIQEKMDCSEEQGEFCPTPELYRFNTNVVFDRSGAVVDRYRKINLFGEPSRTPALRPDLGVFTTDFGVTFGHFICFDLMFQVPAIQVLQKYNITDVVFTTMWFAEMPFLTAVEIQEAYAYTNNVNFLASGASNTNIGSAGSGIYSGSAGALISTNSGLNTRRLLVSKVPKKPGQVSEITYPGAIRDNPAVQDGLFLKRDQSIPAHVSRLLQGTEEIQEFELEDGEVRCRFVVKLRANTGAQMYVYRATVFDGVRSFDGIASGGSRVCSIVACTSDDIITCGTRFSAYIPQSTAIFEQLSITATLPHPIWSSDLQAMDAAYFPTSLDVAILPLSPSLYQYTTESDSEMQRIDYQLREERDELLSFAIWGRLFPRDGEPATEPRF